MKNKKWREFERLAEECYLSMAGMGKGRECWHKAYEVLKEIIADGRSKQPDYSAELYQLDDDTDYCYDIQGWLEDYLDETESTDTAEESGGGFEDAEAAAQEEAEMMENEEEE